MFVFTHPWSFYQYFIVTLVSTGYYLYKKRPKTRNLNVHFFIYYILSLGLSEVLKTLYFPGGGGFTTSVSEVNRLSGFLTFWFDSIFSLRLLYGGTISSFVLFLLGIIGIYYLASINYPKIFFTILPALSSFLFFIGDATIKSRLLFNIPIGLYAAYGFQILIDNYVADEVRSSFMSFVILYQLTYLFRTLVNFI